MELGIEKRLPTEGRGKETVIPRTKLKLFKRNKMRINTVGVVKVRLSVFLS